MRIAQVIHTFPPYSVGGSENYTLALSQELQRQGHRVAIFHRIADATKEEYAVEHGEVEGLPVWRLNHVFRDSDQFEKLYQDAAIDQRFAAFLDAFQPDVIHIHHLTCLSTSSVFEARKRGCPVVMTLHDYWLICQRGQFLKTDLTLCPGQEDRECVKCLTRELVVSEANKKIMTTYRRLLPGVPSPLRWLAAQLRKAYVRYYGQFFVQRRDDAVQKVRRRMDHIRQVCEHIDLFIAPSRFLADKFLAFGIPPTKLLYADYGYDTTSFSDGGRGSRKQEEKLRFGFIGVVFPPKGVHILLEAFRAIGEDEAELVIHGNMVPYAEWDRYDEQLQALAAGRSNIRFAGPYAPSAVGHILSTLDVLIVPSIWYENSPLTIHEAFLARVPVITADLGGMRELIEDGVTGLLFRPRDAGDLREKIRQFIRDPHLVQQLSARAPAVKTISEDAAELENQYRRLLATGGCEKRTQE